MDDMSLMRMALELASEALATGDVPVAALVVDPSGLVIASATNTKERDHDPTAHAEVVALR
ncbi:MAG: deaminase, partial [Pontimonas sp.]|nr:deaminase [Pontimonas sp.]